MKLACLTREDNLHAAPHDMTVIGFRNPAEINLDQLRDSDGILLDCGDTDAARSILERIRRVEEGNVYLKPVFLGCVEEVRDKELLALVDGTVELPVETSPLLARFSSVLKKIQERISRLEPVHPESTEMSAALMALRFMYTRDIPLAPVARGMSRLGYVYPLLASLFRKGEEYKVFDILMFLEKERYVDGECLDRINLCNKCHAAFLNFREVCRCGSPDLKLEDLYHHFTCAYVGPESDFGHTGALVCPKCRRNLKHIGVDYDKPSVQYTCNKCQETFQEPSVKAFCFSCSNDAPVEILVSRDIKRYVLTAKGEQAAIFGIQTTMKDVITFGGLTDFHIFRTILHYEIERAKRVARGGSIAYLRFDNFQDLYLYGAHKEEIFTEIIELIRDSIRPSDVISYLDESTLLFFFSDTAKETASIPVKRMQEHLLKLIHDNFESFSPKIHADISDLRPDLDLDEFYNRIRSR